MDPRKPYHRAIEIGYGTSLGIFASTSKPKEVSETRMKFDEANVQKCCEILDSWIPIFDESDDIVSLSSGVNASKDVQQDLLRAKSVGEKRSSDFIKERIKSDDVPFYDPIKKNNLKTFSSMNVNKSIKVRDKNVIVKADREFFGRMLILQEKRGKFTNFCAHFIFASILFLHRAKSMNKNILRNMNHSIAEKTARK